MEKKGLFAKLAKFFKSLKQEFRKIIWPTKKQLLRSTIAVLLVAIILGAFIWLVDFGGKQLVGLTSSVGPKATTTSTTK